MVLALLVTPNRAVDSSQTETGVEEVALVGANASIFTRKCAIHLSEIELAFVSNAISCM